MKIDWKYFDREKIREALLEKADKEFYEEYIDMDDLDMLTAFQELNMKKSTEVNINNFFELLDRLIAYIENKGV